MSRTKEKSTSVSSIPEIDYSFPVVALKDYKPGSSHELGLVEKELLYVLEDKDLFYLCYSPTTKEQGYVPKNYLQRQKPMSVVPGRCVSDFIPTNDNEMVCKDGDRIIAIARYDEHYLLCKNMSRVCNSGRVPMFSIHLDDSIDLLPSIDEYRNRNSQAEVKRESRSRSNTGPSLAPMNTSKEEKILEKLAMPRPRSSSASRLLQLLSPPKEY